jgi:hypothetical protein
MAGSGTMVRWYGMRLRLWPRLSQGKKGFAKLITNARVIAYARRLGMELVGKKKWAEVSCRGSGSRRTRQARPTSNSC